MGGNRVPLWRWIVNTLIVWLVSGIWHGANWTFIAWGLLHGVLLVVTGLPKQIKKRRGIEAPPRKGNIILKILAVCVTFAFVNFGWVLFRSSNIREAARFMWHMVKVWVPSSYSVFADPSISKANWLFFVALALVGVLILLKLVSHYKEHIFQRIKVPNVLRSGSVFAVAVVFFAISIFVFLYLNSIGGGESSFIYFDF